MSLLVNMFREQVAKMKDPRMKDESGTSVGYSTGFLSFDFRNGTIMHGKKMYTYTHKNSKTKFGKLLKLSKDSVSQISD